MDLTNSIKIQEFYKKINKEIELNNKQFRVAVFTSKFKNKTEFQEHLKKIFEIKIVGEIVLLNLDYSFFGRKRIVKYFILFFEEENLCLFFTDGNASEVSRTIYKIDKIRGMFRLYLPPLIFSKIKEELLAQNATISEFYSERNLKWKKNCKIRPEFNRKIHYKGNDGKTVLEEFILNYGILPTNIDYTLPKIRFNITNKGILTLRWGNIENLLEILFEIVIKSVTSILNPLKKARLDLEEREGFVEIKMEQLIIKLKKDLTYETLEEAFMAPLREEKITFFNKSLRRGSIIFSALASDDMKGNIISITMNKNTIKLVPKYNATFDSLYRFFEVISERVDNEAYIK